jgi:hypothetical protein
MESQAEVILSLAHRAVQTSTMLTIHDFALAQLALALTEDRSDQAEQVRFELYELRSMIARDSFNSAQAIMFADIARGIALKRRDWSAMCRLSLVKSTAALVSDNPDLASVYINEALRTLRRVPQISKGLLMVEARGSITHHLVTLGKVDQAESMYTKAIIPQSLRIETPGLCSARFSTLARIQMWEGRLPAVGTERNLVEAETQWRQDYSALRELQWRVALAQFLSSSNDENGAIVEAKRVRNLLQLGQFRHQGAEALLQAFDLTMPFDERNGYMNSGEMNQPGEGETKAGSVFNTYVFGGSSNIAQGSSHVLQSAVSIGRDDFQSLRALLETLGIEQKNLDLLPGVLAADSSELEGGRPAKIGSRTSRWLQNITFRSGSLAGKIGVGAAGGVAAKAIESYLGIK